MSALFERERELAELDAMVADACAGAGRLAVVEAAAGLGKTRLLLAARERGRAAGMQVLAARATELERAFLRARPPAVRAGARGAGGAAARGAVRGRRRLGAQRRPDPGPGAPPAAQADAFSVLHGLYWLTAAFAEQRPLLLAVDDAHWSDAASLDFLAFLLPRLEELPLLLVVACRPDEPGAEPTLARVATDSLARRLTPRPLSPRATTALLADELEHQPEEAFAAACHEVSGGNPFLLGELARTIAAERIDPAVASASRVRELAPERVTRTVLVRLGRLSREAQAVARAVVVLGDGSDGPLAAELAGLDEAAAARGADELRAAVILDRDGSLRFVHPLVRTALDAELPAGERAAAHLRAVELLRARGASAQQLAAHLVATEARGERATAETLLEAAWAALDRGAPRSASAYLMRALDEPAPDDLRSTILSSLMTATARAPDRALFATLLPEVLAQMERDPSLRPRWSVKVSVWMTLNGRVEGAAPLLERAIEVAEANGDVERSFRLEAQLSLVKPRTLPQTRAQLEPYAAAIPSDSPAGRLLAAYQAEWHAFDGTAADATEAARRALAHDSRICHTAGIPYRRCRRKTPVRSSSLHSRLIPLLLQERPPLNAFRRFFRRAPYDMPRPDAMSESQFRDPAAALSCGDPTRERRQTQPEACVTAQWYPSTTVRTLVSTASQDGSRVDQLRAGRVAAAPRSRQPARKNVASSECACRCAHENCTDALRAPREWRTSCGISDCQS